MMNMQHDKKCLLRRRKLTTIFKIIYEKIIKIDFKKFMVFNVIGALAWIGILASIGYYLGTYVWVQQNIGYIVIGLIIITTIPVVITYFKGKKK